MPNTYTQIHIHTIFAVQNRAALIDNAWKDLVYQYISAIIQNQGHKMLAINGMPDHIHILFGMRPVQSLSELIQDVKTFSSKWINEKEFCSGKFEWQQGFGAFSYSKSDVSNVIRYIQRQEEHHKKQDFLDEYRYFLKQFGVDYRPEYIFKNPA